VLQLRPRPSYREKITDNFERLDDQSWSRQLHSLGPPSWLTPIVPR
jgi:hypothetical protein